MAKARAKVITAMLILWNNWAFVKNIELTSSEIAPIVVFFWQYVLLFYYWLQKETPILGK